MRILTPLEKWSYAVGNMPYAVKDVAFNSFVVFYYTQVQGLSGTLAGIAMFVALVWDAISDPIVGSWSDRVRSRWGRRHPLLVAGGIPTALMFVALFHPPGGIGQTAMFLWMTLSAILLRTFLTVYFIPYSALGAELSSDYDERTVISKARVSMAWLAGMLLPALAFALIFISDGTSDGRLVASNYTHYGIISTIIALASVLFCVWGTRTVIDRLPQGEDNPTAFSLKQPLSDLKTAFGNHNFRMKVCASLAFGMAAGVAITLGLYVGTYFWEFSTDQLAGLVVPTAVGTLMGFVLLGRLGKHFDKPTILGAAAVALSINASWMICARLLGWLPDNGHIIIYGMAIVQTAISTFLIITLQVLSISIVADILDEQELNTGQRQEGVFFAASAFVSKATSGVGALVAGVVIDIAGLETGAEPGTVSTGVLQSLGLFTIVPVAILALVAFGFYRAIHMNREDHRRVQEQLSARFAETNNT